MYHLLKNEYIGFYSRRIILQRFCISEHLEIGVASNWLEHQKNLWCA